MERRQRILLQLEQKQVLMLMQPLLWQSEIPLKQLVKQLLLLEEKCFRRKGSIAIGDEAKIASNGHSLTSIAIGKKLMC